MNRDSFWCTLSISIRKCVNLQRLFCSANVIFRTLQIRITQFEEQVNIKFCIWLREDLITNLWHDDQSIQGECHSQAAVCKWFRHNKDGQQSLEGDVQKRRLAVAYNKETTGKWVLTMAQCHMACAMTFWKITLTFSFTITLLLAYLSTQPFLAVH